MKTPINQETFDQWVRDALNHLYDSSSLRNNPLGGLFNRTEQDRVFPPEQRIRRALLEAIQLLRPAQGTPAQSTDWRTYRILLMRFVEGASPDEVMQCLSLSRSHYFHEQSRGMEYLINQLWRTYGSPKPTETRSEPEIGLETQRLMNHTFRLKDEVQILVNNAQPEKISLSGMLSKVLEMLSSVIKESHTTLEFITEQEVMLFVDRVMLRQVVINFLVFAIEYAANNRLTLHLSSTERQARLEMVINSDAIRTHPFIKPPGVDLAEQIMLATGGMVAFLDNSLPALHAILEWPIQKPLILLVVDDDKSYYSLFARYLVGKNWSVLGAGNGEEARQIIFKNRPAAITLDVCMPHEDGWEFLRYLKDDQETRDIPVIVCSVLEQPLLAQALGANQYLPKPVSQATLLSALDNLISPNFHLNP